MILYCSFIEILRFFHAISVSMLVQKLMLYKEIDELCVTAPRALPTRESIYTNNINSSVAMHSSKYQRVKSACSALGCFGFTREHFASPFSLFPFCCTRRSLSRGVIKKQYLELALSVRLICALITPPRPFE
jgi:hypothetical protein